MKTSCLRKGRNIFRSGFDPKGPTNNDEHISGFTMRLHGFRCKRYALGRVETCLGVVLIQGG